MNTLAARGGELPTGGAPRSAVGVPTAAGYRMWMNLATLGVPSAVMAKSGW